MRYTTLPGTDRDASVIALGTAWYGTEIPEATAFELLDCYAEQGGNLLDTANMYASWVDGGAGKSETTLGRWLRQARPEKMLVATKGADQGMDRETIRSQLSESLERLQLDAVDFYWLHRDDHKVPADEVLGWMNECVDDGLFPAFGCSNWRLPRVREAAEYAKRTGCRGFAASQISWSLARAIPAEVAKQGLVFMDDEIFRYHSDNAWPCVGFSSQSGGFFAGKYDPIAPTPNTTPNANIVRLFGSPENYARLAAAKKIAAARGVSPNQAALAYLFSLDFPGFAIAGPNCIAQVLDSCGAGDLTLTPEECCELSG